MQATPLQQQQAGTIVISGVKTFLKIQIILKLIKSIIRSKLVMLIERNEFYLLPKAADKMFTTQNH